MKRSARRVLVVFAVILTFVLVLKGSALLIASGTWQATGTLSSARAGASAALLPDGRILITGGDSGTGAAPTADIFNTDGTISAAPPMTYARTKHVSVALQDGRILVAGGVTAGGSATSSAEIFDPIANTWTPVGLGMTEARSGATAALLQDGRVLIAGGQNAGTISSTIEIFDPTLGAFTAAGMMSSPRTQHAMTLLHDGRALMVGGFNGTGPVASTDIFDPVAGTVTAGPTLVTARFAHSATTLLNGVVVVIGGNNGNANPQQEDATAAEMIDFTAATPAFATLSTNLATPREAHAALLLPNNNSVLILGGTSGGTAIASAELFTPQESTDGVWTYAFGPTGAMTTPRSAFAASANQVNVPSSTMFRNGIVAVAGGSDVNGNALNTTEAYGYPTVQTDLSDYAPGTTVTITGSGFQPGETITIQLVEFPLFDTHGPYTVQADANGNFIDQSFSPDEHDIDIRFFLSAIGATSGFVAQNTFTDANNFVITGKVTNVSNGTGISGVTIKFFTDSGLTAAWNPASTTTAANGSYTSGNGDKGGTVFVEVIPTAGFAASGATVSGCSPAASVVSPSVISVPDPSNGGECDNNNFQLVAAGPAAKLAFLQQPSNTAAGSTITPAVTVQVEDSNGHLVNTSTASISIAIGANPGSGTLSGTTPVSAVGGIATFSDLAINKAGASYTLTASSNGLTNTISNFFNVTAGAVSAGTSTVVANPTSVTADGTTTSTITVTLLDANSNPVSGKTVTLTAGSGSSTITPGSGTSDTNGQVTFNVKDTKAESVTYTAKDTTDNVTITQTASVTFAAGPVNAAKSTVVANPTSVTADGTTTSTITVTLLDANNNPVSGKTVTLTAGSGSSTITPGSGTTNASGQATFTVKDTVVESVTYTGKDTTDTVTITQMATVNFTVGAVSAATSTVSANPTSVTADGSSTSTITVTLLDSSSRPVSGKTVTLTAGSGSSTITPGTGTSDTNGQVTFNVKDTKAETVTYTGKDSTDSITITQTASVTFTPGAVSPTKSTVTANPTSVTADGITTSTITVTLLDANTNPVSGKTVTLSQGTGSSTISAASGPSNASGIVTFTVKDTKAETVTYSATDASDAIPINQTASVTFTPGPITQLVFTTIGTQTVGTPFNITVTAEDANGNTVSSYSADGNNANISSTGTLAGGSFTSPAFTNGALVQSVTITNAGSFTISATGNAGHAASGITGKSNSFTVNQATTSTTVVSSANPSTFGQSVTFTATVTDSSPGSTGTPTGSVTFKDGANTLGTGTVNGSGVATFSTTTLSVSGSPHSISAVYGGDANYTGSTSSALSQTVNQASTTTAVVSSANPSTFGQSVTFTATVSSGGNAITSASGESVTFKDGATTLGTGTVNASGVATFSTATLSVSGSPHSITAVYGGDANYTGSTSAVLSQTVNQASTTTAVVSSANPSTFGQSVTFTATVSSGGTPITTASGENVTFKDGATTLGTGTVNASGVATFSTATLSVSGSPHSITAVYASDANYTGSTSSALSQTVGQAATSSSLTSSPNPSFFGQQVTFTATVSSTAGTPTGAVNFLDGATQIGSGTLAVVAGNDVASFSTSTLSATTHSITAVYVGDSNFKTSTSNPVSQVVNNAATTTTVMSSVNPSVFGQGVSFTATVAPQQSGLGTPAGTVQFYIDSVAFGAAATLDASGNATSAATAALSVGTHTITATYTPATGSVFQGSTSAPLTQTVNQDGTVTMITATPNPSAFGQLVNITVTVAASAPGSGTPSGTVMFMIDNTPAIALTLVDGSASTSISSLAPGNHTFTANYSADANFSASMASVNQSVTQATTSTTLSLNMSTINFGQSTTVTATVTDTSSGSMGTPTGTVSVTDGIGNALGDSCTITLANGTGTCVVTPTATAPTGSTVTGTYSGDTNFQESTGTTSLTVNAATTQTMLTSSPNPSILGQAVAFTAAVTDTSNGDSAVPNGTVSFFDGSMLIGTAILDGTGHATFTTAILSSSASPHSISAYFNGNVDFSASMTSSPASQAVNPRASNTSVNLAPSTIPVGAASTVTVSVADATTTGPSGTPGAFALSANSLNTGRTGAVAALLPSGKVLVAGGQDASSTVLSTAEVYDPAAGSFVLLTGSGQTLNTARTGATATPLPNGTILIAGGSSDGSANSALASAEIFDPSTGTFTALTGANQNLTTPRFNAAAALANNGTAWVVIIAGGENGSGSLNTMEVFDPAHQTFSSIADTLTVSREGATATALYNGKILFAGGASASAEIYDLVGHTSTTTGSMIVDRTNHGAALLPDGNVLVVGGNSSGTAVATAELYNTGTGAFTAAANNMIAARSGLTATLLDTAQVLVVGGSNSGHAALASTELYTPSFDPLGNLALSSSDGTDSIPSSCALTLTGTGTTSCQVTDTPSEVGTNPHTITATYTPAPDQVHTGSSNSANLTVTKADTTTSLTSTANPSVFGQSVTFTVTVGVVSPGSGSPTGTVDVYDGGTCAAPGTSLATGLALSGGTAIFSTGSLSVSGSPHSIFACYSGDANFNKTGFDSASTATTLNQMVNPAPTSTSVASSQNPSNFGQSVTFTATISNTAGAGVSTATPTGSVQFVVDGSNFGSPVTLSGSGASATATSNAIATLNVSNSPHTVSAVYTNTDQNFSSGNGSLSGGQVVQAASTSTTVLSNPNPSIYGQWVTFTALITNTATGSPAVPTGTVSFTIDGGTAVAGTIQTCPSAIPANRLCATYATSALTVSGSPHSVSASYTNSDGNFLGSNGALAGGQTVNPAPTSTTVVSSLNPSNFGQSVTFTATVTNTAGASVSTATPTGAVQFVVDGSNYGLPVALAGSGASATATSASTATLSVSSSPHTVIANYLNADGNFSNSSGSLSGGQVVKADVTSTAVASSLNPSVYGQSVSFTATVTNTSSTGVTPTGSVQFVIDGGNYGLPVPIMGSGNTATGTSTATSAIMVTGSPHSVTANYVNSDGNFQTSMGTLGSGQSVTPAPLTITASSGVMTYGAASPVVVVAEYIGPNNFVNGEGSGALNPQPTCGPAFTSATPAATYVTACTGAADANYTITYVPGSVIVNPANTSTQVSASPNPSNWANVVTLTATVTNTSTPAPPTGSVSFYDASAGATCTALGSGTTLIDTDPVSGTGPYQAVTTTPSLMPGTHTILACYNYSTDPMVLNPNLVPSSGTTSQTVIPAPIATLTPSSLSFGSQQGGTTSAAQTITLCNGPSGASGSACYGAPVSTAALMVNSIAFTDSNTAPAYFTQSSTCPIGGSGLTINNSCTISVKFAPPVNASGIATALVTVTDNNENVNGSTQNTSVTGAGTSAINGVGSLSSYAIVATTSGCSTVTVSGNGSVDSYDGSTNSGNVGTNGNVTLSGNASINGTVYSPNSGTGACNSKAVTGLSTSGKAQATGGLMTLPSPLSYPLPLAPKPAPPSTNQAISGTCGSISGCTQNGSKTVSLAPGQYGNVSVSANTTVHVKAGTYNINSLTLSGNSILYVDSGPVVINLAGGSLNSSSPAMDLSGGSIVNPSGITSNLQFYYAGSNSIKLSGGSGSYALVYAPNSPINLSGGSHFYGSIVGSTVNSSGNTATHGDVALPSIHMGNFIWFSSGGLNVQGLPNSGSVKLYVTNASISFTANGNPYSLNVPNAVITFSSTATSASTTWDAVNNRWSTLVPMSSVNGNATIHSFFDAIAYQVPADFPGGIQNVTWQAAYSTSTTGLKFNWQFGAAVYSSLPASGPTGNYTSFGVNPLDNSDPAGTPENYKSNLIFGDLGAGYTGLYEGTAGVVPTIAPISVSPSNYDFGSVPMNTTATSIPIVLTNNDSVPYTINSIQLTSSRTDFIQTNNCPISPNMLGAGLSCSFTITFTPTAATGTKETAKITINDTANNSPQTIFVKGTSQ